MTFADLDNTILNKVIYEIYIDEVKYFQTSCHYYCDEDGDGIFEEYELEAMEVSSFEIISPERIIVYLES